MQPRPKLAMNLYPAANDPFGDLSVPIKHDEFPPRLRASAVEEASEVTCDM
jgi:hypothetical protein